ncbi:MAG: hypothetical protein AAF702_41920 [Chloroflexota bacterium]
MTHSIFQTYPLEMEKVQTSAGEQPTPYHIYSAHGLLIAGTADFDKVGRLLENEQVYPVQTIAGKALMALWVIDGSEASHGAHTEFQVSFYVSHQPLAPADDSPFALLKLLLTESHARQMCHGLWNNTPEVVAYNCEILGLTAKLVQSEFNRSGGRVTFSFRDSVNQELIAEGSIREMKRPPLSAGIALFRSLGVGQALRAAAMKVLTVRVVNPISDVLTNNVDALTASSSDSIVAQLFDSRHDQVRIANPIYAGLGFEPIFVEHMVGFKMVYLTPQATHELNATQL